LKQLLGKDFLCLQRSTKIKKLGNDTYDSDARFIKDFLEKFLAMRPSQASAEL
jgi:hypothetical protein